MVKLQTTRAGIQATAAALLLSAVVHVSVAWVLRAPPKPRARVDAVHIRIVEVPKAASLPAPQKPIAVAKKPAAPAQRPPVAPPRAAAPPAPRAVVAPRKAPALAPHAAAAPETPTAA